MPDFGLGVWMREAVRCETCDAERHRNDGCDAEETECDRRQREMAFYALDGQITMEILISNRVACK